MATFGQMTSDLRLLLMAKLLDSDIQAFINQAQREEVEAFEWSYLLTNTVIYTAATQTSGTISLSQGSKSVVGDINTNFVLPPNSVSQLNIGSPTGSTPYPVFSALTPHQLVLIQPFNGTSVTGVSYNLSTTVYSVIAPNGAPFIEIYSVRGPGGFLLEEVSREVLNEKDPSRTTYGGNPPTQWANAGFDANGNVQIEFWPVNTAVNAFVIEGKIGPLIMANTTDLPQIPSVVLEAKAAYLAFTALYASNGNDKYETLAQNMEKRYLEELDKSKFADMQRTVTKKMENRRPLYGLDIYAVKDVLP